MGNWVPNSSDTVGYIGIWDIEGYTLVHITHREIWFFPWDIKTLKDILLYYK